MPEKPEIKTRAPTLPSLAAGSLALRSGRYFADQQRQENDPCTRNQIDRHAAAQTGLIRHQSDDPWEDNASQSSDGKQDPYTGGAGHLTDACRCKRVDTRY